MGDSYPGGTGTLSYNQVEQLWTNNGGDPRWAPLMASIAMAESSGHTGVLNNTPATGDYSVGLWQINYYGNLLNSRTQQYGTPATLWNDPNAQAKAAVQIFANGRGAGAWQGDTAYQAWKRAGAPMFPTAAQLSNFGAPVGAGGASNVAPPPGGSTPTAPTPSPYGGISVPLLGQIVSPAQEMIIKGWFFVLAGAAVGIVGFSIVLASLGLETKIGRTAAEVVPGGVALKAAAGRGTSTQRSRGQATERRAAQRQADRMQLVQERGSQSRATAASRQTRSEPGARPVSLEQRRAARDRMARAKRSVPADQQRLAGE